MFATTLADLRCPVCHSPLRMDEDRVPYISVDSPRGTELREALLRCGGCNFAYPVIAGVAIVVPNPLAYIARNLSTILVCASPYLSAEMLDFVKEHGLDLVGNEVAISGSGSPTGIPRYLFAHYENLGEALPEAHPLFALASANGGDWYSALLALASQHRVQGGRALDVGCSVGGVVHRLAEFHDLTYGIDYSFPAVLTARRVLLGEPGPLRSYRLVTDGSAFEERPLKVETRANLDLLVASADRLPFPGAYFDEVTCLNLTDVVPNPAVMFAGLLDVTSGDGLLTVTDPYYWNNSISPLELWIGGRRDGASSAAMRHLDAGRFEVLAERDMVPWVLREYDRHYKVYLNHHLVLRKVA